MHRHLRLVPVAAVLAGACGLLAGCAEAVQGRAVPAATAELSDPAPNDPAPSDAAGPNATEADVPALVEAVEGVFDAISTSDYEQACGYLDFGAASADPATIDLCSGGLESGFEGALGSESPADQEAARLALSSITVDPGLVELSGDEATIPRVAVISTITDTKLFITNDIEARLSTEGWLIDPFSLQQ